MMDLASFGRGLNWQQWDDVYIVYQASSAETHVFNETTAAILRSLEHGPLTTEAVKDWTEAVLGMGNGELDADDFTFATARLEELGLVDLLEEPLAAQ